MLSSVSHSASSGNSSARSEEHTSELQSLMRISYAVFPRYRHVQPHSSPYRPSSALHPSGRRRYHDLAQGIVDAVRARGDRDVGLRVFLDEALAADLQAHRRLARRLAVQHPIVAGYGDVVVRVALGVVRELLGFGRSEEHTSELQSLMRISYAVFCLKKKKTKT